MADLKLVVAGASGRMGRTLIREIAQGSGITLCGALEVEGHPNLGLDSGTLAGMQANGITLTADPLPVIAQAQGIVDFTTPMVSMMLADLAAQARIVHVIGTTGFTPANEERIKAAARHAVIVKSGNMSMGVNLLAALVERAARSLPDYDIEVLEMHHRNKVDAPSGTALLLGHAAARGQPTGKALGEVARRPYRGARRWRHRFRDLARRHGGGRACGDLRRRGRAHHPVPFGGGPHHLRPWRAECRQMGPWEKARPVFHDGCSGALRCPHPSTSSG
jgi:4-hydroxy-tetrahydrodipicolinate reductase